MMTSDTDWRAHVAAYQASGRSLSEYCQSAGVKITTLRHHVYKKKAKRKRPVSKPAFEEVPITCELVITRMPSGELSLRGFDAQDLAALIGAWSHAVQV